jgi:hypothetical protein
MRELVVKIAAALGCSRANSLPNGTWRQSGRHRFSSAASVVTETALDFIHAAFLTVNRVHFTEKCTSASAAFLTVNRVHFTEKCSSENQAVGKSIRWHWTVRTLSMAGMREALSGLRARERRD